MLGLYLYSISFFVNSRIYVFMRRCNIDAFMQAWYMCIKLADAVEAVMSSFRVIYQYTASIIEHCDLAAMRLMVQCDFSTIPLSKNT